jgi:hypothetical protein
MSSVHEFHANDGVKIVKKMFRRLVKFFFSLYFVELDVGPCAPESVMFSCGRINGRH